MQQQNFLDDQAAAAQVSQPALFTIEREEQIDQVLRTRRDRLAFTWYRDERELIIDMAKLHAPNWFDLDPTYSKGAFWAGLPQPTHKSDIAPQVSGVREADAAHLPHHADQSLQAIMFDPPFVVGNHKPGIIKKRFSLFPEIDDLWTFYARALKEFHRILKHKGAVFFKCQDTVDAGRNYMTHAAVIDMAEKIGFYNKDLFILVRDGVLISPNVRPENQQHGRKTHCYYLVLTKETRKDKTAVGVHVDKILDGLK